MNADRRSAACHEGAHALLTEVVLGRYAEAEIRDSGEGCGIVLEVGVVAGDIDRIPPARHARQKARLRRWQAVERAPASGCISSAAKRRRDWPGGERLPLATDSVKCSQRLFERASMASSNQEAWEGLLRRLRKTRDTAAAALQRAESDLAAAEARGPWPWPTKVAPAPMATIETPTASPQALATSATSGPPASTQPAAKAPQGAPGAQTASSRPESQPGASTRARGAGKRQGGAKKRTAARPQARK